MVSGADERRPFGLEISQAVCDRATRLAKALFGALDAQVILMRDGEVWRSREVELEVRKIRDPGAENMVLVTFDQDYQSNNLNNQMKKRQYWVNEDGTWKIIFEGAG